MLLQYSLVALTVFQVCAGQVWPPPPGNFLYANYNPQQNPYVTQQQPGGTIPLNIPNAPFPNQFAPVPNGIWNNPGIPLVPPQFHGPVIQQPPLPRLTPARVELSCDVPAGGSYKIRWVKQESLTPASTVSVIAEDKSVVYLPSVFAVKVDVGENGAVRSTLAIKKPDPDFSQAVFYCQLWDPTSNQQSVSREVYILGNRQFINANLNYQAVDYTKRSVQPVRADKYYVTPDPRSNRKNETIYHSNEDNEE